MPYTPKGLATVALLKTRLDAGADHIGLFEPFVIDALRAIVREEFGTEDVKALINERTGIIIPSDTLKTLLARCARRDLVQREGGRYFLKNRPEPDATTEERRRIIVDEQTQLATAFRQFAFDEGLMVESVEAALGLLSTVISDAKVHLVLKEPVPDSLLERSSLPRKTTRIVARFVAGPCATSPALAVPLENMVEGTLLHDALFLKDLAVFSQRFEKLTIAFDTPILFAALGLTGPANSIAAKEGLALVREAGARTIVFDRTINEMHRVLAVYEDRLATSSGRSSLFATDLTRHVLAERLSSADIRIISATLPTQLEALGVHVVEYPAHEARYTLDEGALEVALADKAKQGSDAARVQHDVDCVAAILTLRKGKVATSIERSVGLFCTSSGKVVKNVQEWYRAQERQGIPPVVHQAALTSIAWLKKPAAAPGLKLHELIAVCVAAIRPTRETWQRMTENLRRLQIEGRITDDESAAIVSSELIEPMLARLDEEFDPDAASIVQAIERVREEYRREAAVDAEHKVRAAEERRAVSEREKHAAVVERNEAAATRDAALQIIDQNIRRSAWRTARAVFGVLIIVTVAAAFLAIPGVFDSVGPGWKWAARLTVAGAVVLSTASRVFGGSLLSWCRGLANILETRDRRRLLVHPEIPIHLCQADSGAVKDHIR